MTSPNGRPIHTNTLRKSNPDDIALALAVEDKFLHLCHLCFKIRGIQLVPPQSLNSDILQWRRMRVRHKKGDFRSSEAEIKSVRAIAEWTLLINSELRNQKTVQKVEWKD